jgi:hypothetical protein
MEIFNRRSWWLFELDAQIIYEIQYSASLCTWENRCLERMRTHQPTRMAGYFQGRVKHKDFFLQGRFLILQWRDGIAPQVTYSLRGQGSDLFFVLSHLSTKRRFPSK